MVKGFCRHLIEPALTGMADADHVPMAVLANMVPDKGLHLKGLAGLKTGEVRKLFGGMSPLAISSWACLLASGARGDDLALAVGADVKYAWAAYDEHRSERLAPARPPNPEDPYSVPTGRDLLRAALRLARQGA